MTDFSFGPDGSRAHELDASMRLSLAQSLQHLSEQSVDVIEFDDAKLQNVIAQMNAGMRFPPSTFGLYSQAVLALLDESFDKAGSVLDRLANERPSPPSWRVLPIDDAAHVTHHVLYEQLLSGEDTMQFALMEPAPEAVEAFRARLLESHAWMMRAIPELAAEFDALVSDVILVAGDESAAYKFDGGSAYMLWGGLFLNATTPRDLVSMIEVMTHESAHMLLYAFARDEVLVANEDDELFTSPLRADPRPMDGIYHATFVSARMHWAMARLAQSELLDAASRARAREAMASDERNFRAGHGVVAEHGKLTATGRDVMDAALAYMDSIETSGAR